MALDLRRFIERFIGEARDHLSALEHGLADLGEHPDDPEAVNALFRSAHTIKGSARMLKLSGISETAHCMEDLLGAVRAGHCRPGSADIALLLNAVDALGNQLDRVAAGGTDAPADPELCAALARVAGAGPAGDPDPGRSAAPATTSDSPTPDFGRPEAAAVGGAPETPAVPPPAPAPDHTPDRQPDQPQASTTGAGRPPETVRLPLARLDELIGLIGELGRAQARQRGRLAQARALAEAAPAGGGLTESLRALVRGLRDDLTEAERLGAELGERALGLRLLPLSTVFEPAARMVRELARAAGKEVRCEVTGAEIELDRAVIAGLGEALVQVLRNAVDHGLESAADRRAAGKPESGLVRITARHASGGVEVEVADDGRGLARERILARALERGLVDPGRAAALSDEQVWELIYAPGLSTSETVTDLSGRGVGMDVIRRTITAELHGTLTLGSRPGAGTRFVFQLPRSLAVMRVLVCECAGLHLGLPAQHVVELLRLGAAEALQLDGRPAVVLRNELIPLVPLARLLGPLPGPAADTGSPPGATDGTCLAAVIGLRSARVGLLVERVTEERAMLIRPLPAPLRGGALAAGLVVMDDERLVTVLSAAALLDAARALRGAAAAATAGQRPRPVRPWRVLVVDDSPNTRDIVKEVLDAYGYQVSTADDGLAAWRKAQGGRFDAVLTDVEMPGLDGFALSARLRTDPHYQTTPIVIISSRASEEDRRRGVEAGADAYIVKGDFDQSGLLATLANLLGEPRPLDD